MKLRIGSRGSRLAVTQAETVAALIRAKNPGLEIELHRITTAGDRDLNSSLATMGGKGVFVKEIEDALLRKDIDLAVHSLKDVPQALPLGLRLGPPPAREDARDAVVSRFGELLRELPRGSTVGTSSPRRAAQVKNRFRKRDYRIESLRGNVDTRLKKLHAGTYDAIIVAAAGMNRLGLSGEVTEILETEDMLPAPCQGCLGLEIREEDAAVLAFLQGIKDDAADITSRAERAFLQAIGGDCLVPLGAHAVLAGDQIKMTATLLDADGERAVTSVLNGDAGAPELIGAQLAEQLFHDGASEILLGPPPAV